MQRPTGEADGVGGHIGLAGLFDRSPQHASHARRELANIERLRDVVVGANLRSNDPIDGFAAPRDDDHGNRGVLAQRAHQGESVLARKPEVQQQQVDVRFGQRGASPSRSERC